MPKLPAARRGDKTGHALLHGSGGAGRAASCLGVVMGEGRHRGATHGAQFGAAFGEGRGGVRLEHLANAIRAANKTGEGDDDGPIHTGSPNVLIGGTDKLAARAGVDVAKCPAHRHRELYEGSATVLVNGQPAARASERLKCSGGHLLGGCETVLIGGASTTDGSAQGARSTSKGVSSARCGAALGNRALHEDVLNLLGLDGASEDPSDVAAFAHEAKNAGRTVLAGAAIARAGLGGASGAILGGDLAG